MRRAGVLLVLAAWFLMAWARPAGAHGAGGIVATNFETAVGGVSPSLPGVRVRMIEAGSRLELRNEGAEVVILGAEGEPYLRVGPDGAFENRQSPTTARNRRQVHEPAGSGGKTEPAGSGGKTEPAGSGGKTEPAGSGGTTEPAGSGGKTEPAGSGGTTEQPAPAAVAAGPEWHRLSGSPLVRWHDHRTDWEGPRNPPEVERDPGRRHVVLPRWEIPLERGDVRSVAFGTLTWVPGPSPAPWFGLMAAAFAGVAGLGLLRRWGVPLAVVTAVVLVADLVHAVSVAFAFAGGLGAHVAKLVTGSFFAIAGWALAVVAVHLLRRGRVDGLYAAVFAGLSMAVFGGLLDLGKLSRSVSLSALPDDMARLCVALSGGGGLGLAAACLVVIQRTPDARRVVGAGGRDDADEEPAPIAEGAEDSADAVASSEPTR